MRQITTDWSDLECTTELGLVLFDVPSHYVGEAC